MATEVKINTLNIFKIENKKYTITQIENADIIFFVTEAEIFCVKNRYGKDDNHKIYNIDYIIQNYSKGE